MADEAPRTRRKLSSLQLLGAMTVLALLAGALLGWVGAFEPDTGNSALSLVTSAVALGVAAAAVWFCLIYWKRLDEAAREAHKFAWYWGGSLGLGVAGLAVGLMTRAGEFETFVWPGMDATPAGYLMTGALAVVTAQIVGYVLVWAGWWLWKGR